ncbi:MAG: hypothetical protein SGARI_003561 [Bacillariaceae sp.]
MAKKRKKPSMAERRKQRQGKSRGTGRTNPFADLPTAKIDFTPTAAEEEEESAGSNDPIRAANPTEAAEKAKALLKAQRESVNMLTLVKERIDQTIGNPEATDSANAVFETLQTKGFVVIDNFLNDADTLAQMDQEGKTMLVDGSMEVDTANLGTGEYITALQGGEHQYVICPRMVELVVSSTKHIPAAFEGYGDNALELDATACIATLRSFDRKALKASLALLTGTEDDNMLNTANAPLSTIVEGVDDRRKLSMFYYVLPDEWGEECGGGLVFESETVRAKRDRLTIPWKGKDLSSATAVGNSIEIHLVKKP